MACLLTTGRTEPCKDAIGGLSAVYMADYLADSFTVTGSQATAMNVALTSAYEFDLRANNNTFAEEVVSDKNTGNTVNTQTLSVRLKKQDHQTSAEIMLMAKARPIIVVKHRDGSYRVMGISEGCDLTGSSIQSGGARNEFNGYDLTFTAEEVALAPTLDSATVTAFEAVVSATKIDA